jgi:hypothetical protein
MILTMAFSVVNTLMDHTGEYKEALETVLKALDALSEGMEKVAELTRVFFVNDDSVPDSHPIKSVMQDYDGVIQEMTSDVPKRMQKLVRENILEPTATWHEKMTELSDASTEMLDARKTYDHYVEKMDVMENERMRRADRGKGDGTDYEKASRNQGKLQNAEEVYIDLRDKWCEDADDTVFPSKSDFLALALRVVQFQQTLYKSTAKKAEGLNSVVEAIQETLEKGETAWGDLDYNSHKKKVMSAGGDPNAARRKVMEKAMAAKPGGSRDSDSDEESDEEEESKDLSSFKRKTNQLRDEIKYMDEKQFQGAIERLTSRMNDCESRKERKVMKGLLGELEEVWKSKASKAKGRSRNSSTASAGASGVDISRVPPEHVATLRKDPSLAAEFDKIYGPGASAAILRGASGTSGTGGANGNSGSSSARKKPKPEHVDMLLKDPSLKDKFDQIYGEGSAEELLRRTGHQSDKLAKIPPEHIEKLKSNPHLASEFDRIYGPGTADEILGVKGEEEVLELCLDPDQAPPAPDVPVINGKEVLPNHVEMLLNDPSLGDKFDQFYGPGAAKQILHQMGHGSPPAEDVGMMNMMGADTQADAREQPKPEKREASPRSAPRKVPSEKHIQMLRDNPEFASKFDAVYGEGSADAILNDGDENAYTMETFRDGPMFPEIQSPLKLPTSVSPLDLTKIGIGGGGSKDKNTGDDGAEESNSPRTVKWRKENETRAHMGLKPKPHPSKKKK